MTNNPTIDGVSREDLDLVLTYGCGTDASDEAWDRLRALLNAATHEHEWDINAEGTATICYCGARSSDSPAVDRQEPDAKEQWKAAVKESQKRAGIVMYVPETRLEELQSTIAQLQARVAELESGRGEVVAYLHEGADMRVVNFFPTHQFLYGKTTPLFTAPPAPVAVVLPERISCSVETPADRSRVSYVTGYNACLNATAALNGERE